MKALVLFSGGLDSRLAVKILQEQGIEVEAVFFKLPFGGGCCNDEMGSSRFSQLQGIKMNIIDCTKGDLLNEYLDIIKKPKFKTGAGINPCIDCRIFLFKKAQKIAKKTKADFLATGEVLGERPLSQNKGALFIVEEESGLKGKILRPLSAKLLPETQVEEKGLVKRDKLLDIQGRSRKKQMVLAKKFKIKYPSPGGGCLLCEKELAPRFKFLLDKNLINENTLPLVKLGRHFYNKGWLIAGRDEGENIIIEKFQSIVSDKGKPAVYFHDTKNKSLALKLQKAYQDKKPEKFEKYKI